MDRKPGRLSPTGDIQSEIQTVEIRFLMTVPNSSLRKSLFAGGFTEAELGPRRKDERNTISHEGYLGSNP